MPTPRAHGGAELSKVPLNLPAGFRGLNTQQSGAVLDFSWATVLRNTVLDGGGRIAARKGWVRRSAEGSGTGTDRMLQLFEYQTHAGATELIATDDNNVIWGSIDNGILWTQITGTATVTDPNMDFVNYKDKVYGFQEGGTVLEYAGTSFVDFVPAIGTPPDGSVALSAFGRIWASDSGGTFLQYCALLNEQDWDFADPVSNSGGFDHKHIWEGTDTIQAAVEFNNTLVVFGKNNIIIWSDNSGSQVGLDPSSMYVVDTIHGIGCYARDSVVEVDGDLWFLSDSGLQSLSRVIEQRSNPLFNLSRNVHDDILARARLTAPESIHAVYSPEERFVLMCFPDSTTGDETGQVFCFDSRGRAEDGSAPCIGIWNTLVPKCIVRMQDSKELLMFVSAAAPGNIQMFAFTENAAGIYSGYQDPRNDPGIDPIVPYQMRFESGWNNLADPNVREDRSPYLKIPKRMRGTFFTLGTSQGSFHIWYDFDQREQGGSGYPIILSTDESNPSYWTDPKIGGAPGPVTPEGFEWSDDPGGVDAQAAQAGEWTGAFKPVIISVPDIGGSGEYLRLGVQVRIIGFPVSLQELSLYTKLGRLV